MTSSPHGMYFHVVYFGFFVKWTLDNFYTLAKMYDVKKADIKHMEVYTNSSYYDNRPQAFFSTMYVHLGPCLPICSYVYFLKAVDMNGKSICTFPSNLGGTFILLSIVFEKQIALLQDLLKYYLTEPQKKKTNISQVQFEICLENTKLYIFTSHC